MKRVDINNGFTVIRSLVLAGIIVLSVIACSESKPEMLSKRELKELMIGSLNQSVNWWYLGSDDQMHYLLVESTSESKKYSVLSEQVQLKLEKYNYAVSNNRRVKLKLSKIKIK